MTERVVSLSKAGARRRRKKCPVCGRPPEASAAPFCSRRCADEDLRRWLAGEYRVPVTETPAPDENEER